MAFTDTISNIDSRAQILILCWSIFLAACMYAHFKKQHLTPYFLFLSAVSMAAAFALFTPYLYLWDEQFHALVGKNLAKNPFTPELIPQNPVDTDQSIWANGKIWLHKQPLFTWQIALSIKLFGTSAFAVRLPSVLFHGILVITIFRIGSMVFNRKTGFIAALLVLHSTYLLGLISGRIGTDHNDFIFLCYITLSFWAWFEWRLSFNRKWIYWIGVFAGCAILTKWLVGLLVFAGWGIVVIPELRKGHLWNSLKPMLIAFAVALLVSVPWQIYSFLRFPAEFKREMDYNSLHIFQSIEDHTGSWTYHFDRISDIYFNRVDFLIVFAIGLLFLIVSKKVSRENKIYLLTTISVLYLFFTIVETKMPSFTIPAFGFTLLIIAFGISETTGLIKQKLLQNLMLTALSVLLINWMLKPSPTLAHYDRELPSEKHMLKCYHFMTENGSSSTKRVVFGVNFFPHAAISWMFFNDDMAYSFIPSENQIRKVQQKGYSVTIIQTDGVEFKNKDRLRDVEIISFE